MKVCGLTAVILLVLAVNDALSSCPKSGCQCGESCVDSNKRWCNSDKVEECTCQSGCLLYDRLLDLGESQTVYCRQCHCPVDSKDGIAWCSRNEWCKPDNMTLNVDYPTEDGESAGC